MTTALLDRLTHHCHIVETGNESWRWEQLLPDPGRQSKINCKNQGEKSRNPMTYPQRRSYTQRINDGSIFE